jgi:predicted DNA-binding transcriptional regulator YafY
MTQRLGKARKSGSPTPAVARKIGILLDLVRNRTVSLSGCQQTYGASERTILRDLQELRAIGKVAGFRIGDREHGDTFVLSEFKAKPAGIVAGEKRLRALMSELFARFGDPVHDLAEGFRDAGTAPENAGEPSFFHFVQPQLADDTSVGRVYRDLETAWQKNARVEFRYKSRARTVEPAAAVVRSGRYYLIGRDIAKGAGGWRTFAMDLVEEPIRPAGTFVRKAPPEKYLSNDAIGFFKSDGEPQTVQVSFSKTLAPSAVSRKWQRAQKVRHNDDGTVTISFVVDDVDEVIRWSLGFADEAWIAAPATAIARARSVANRIAERYGI